MRRLRKLTNGMQHPCTNPPGLEREIDREPGRERRDNATAYYFLEEKTGSRGERDRERQLYT